MVLLGYIISTRDKTKEANKMIFTEKTEINGIIKIDGYSKAKTIKGALKDLAREVKKHNETEGNAITYVLEDTIGILNQRFNGSTYYIDCEEVSCASRAIDDDNNEYAEANFYIGIGF